MISLDSFIALICTIDENIYVIHQDYARERDYRIFTEKIVEIRIMKDDIYIYTSSGELCSHEYNLKEYGETIFPNKEAAELKLKELKEGE